MYACNQYLHPVNNGPDVGIGLFNFHGNRQEGCRVIIPGGVEGLWSTNKRTLGALQTDVLCVPRVVLSLLPWYFLLASE